MSERRLVRVEAPHFVAGFLISEHDVSVYAAPILRWTVGRKRDDLSAYFKRKGWRASILRTTPNA